MIAYHFVLESLCLWGVLLSEFSLGELDEIIAISTGIGDSVRQRIKFDKKYEQAGAELNQAQDSFPII